MFDKVFHTSICSGLLNHSSLKNSLKQRWKDIHFPTVFCSIRARQTGKSIQNKQNNGPDFWGKPKLQNKKCMTN